MVNNLKKIEEKQKLIEQVVRGFAEKCAEMEIESNIPLTPEQLSLLRKLHVLAINYALTQKEALLDPRKITYIANVELKLGLSAILLTKALVDHLSKAQYTKDFFMQDIVIYTDADGKVKHIDFQKTESKMVQEALFDEIVYDWIVYRTPGGRGINALSDEKTFSQGLKNFYRGFSPVSEFSRFERNYFEYKQKKAVEEKESARRSFQNTIVQEIAVATAKKLLENNDPQVLAQMLLRGKDFSQSIDILLESQTINLSIEDYTKEAQVMDFSIKNPEKEEMDFDKVVSEIKFLQNAHDGNQRR